MFFPPLTAVPFLLNRTALDLGSRTPKALQAPPPHREGRLT